MTNNYRSGYERQINAFSCFFSKLKQIKFHLTTLKNADETIVFDNQKLGIYLVSSIQCRPPFLNGIHLLLIVTANAGRFFYSCLMTVVVSWQQRHVSAFVFILVFVIVLAHNFFNEINCLGTKKMNESISTMTVINL